MYPAFSGVYRGVTKRGHMTTTAAIDDERRQPPGAGRSQVLGCPVDRVNMQQAVEICNSAMRTRTFTQHMAINAAKLVAMRDDDELRAIVNECALITADGQSVVWASRLLGDPLPERVAGIDLMSELIADAEQTGRSIYVLGAREDVLESAMAQLLEAHPDLRVAGYRDGYFTDAEAPQVAAEIRAGRPDMLFVAMPSPRKEYFLGRYSARWTCRSSWASAAPSTSSRA